MGNHKRKSEIQNFQTLRIIFNVDQSLTKGPADSASGRESLRSLQSHVHISLYFIFYQTTVKLKKITEEGRMHVKLLMSLKSKKIIQKEEKMQSS